MFELRPLAAHALITAAHALITHLASGIGLEEHRPEFCGSAEGQMDYSLGIRREAGVGLEHLWYLLFQRRMISESVPGVSSGQFGAGLGLFFALGDDGADRVETVLLVDQTRLVVSDDTLAVDDHRPRDPAHGEVHPDAVAGVDERGKGQPVVALEIEDRGAVLFAYERKEVDVLALEFLNQPANLAGLDLAVPSPCRPAEQDQDGAAIVFDADLRAEGVLQLDAFQLLA